MKDQRQSFSLEEQIAEIIARFPSPQLALLPSVQRLTSEADGGRSFIGRLAAMCEVSEPTVEALLVEYSTPRRVAESGRLCTGLSCTVNGARKILEHAVDGNEKYAWMGSKIEAVSCLGHCFAAPVFADGAGCVHRIEIAGSE